MLVFKFWGKRGAGLRTLLTFLLTATFGFFVYKTDLPLFRIGAVWSALIFAGTLIRFIYGLTRIKCKFVWLGTAWAVAQTFIFITFTRLFFRSGSNLNPAEANRSAWDTAQNMVNQIGGNWDFSRIGEMVWGEGGYGFIILLFVFGMVVHWLPENFKRRYRIWFSALPLWLMAIVTVIAVFVTYQFVSAELRPFIYFQF
jgi:hypothetical protein